MIQSFEMQDVTKLPVAYACDVFENGTKFDFKPGINIIIGENGCGKSTLLKLIKSYLLCTDSQESEYNNFYLPYRFDEFLGGGILKADYVLKAFNLRMYDELSDNDKQKNMSTFVRIVNDIHSSTGEQIINASSSLFDRMFDQKADNAFPIDKIKANKQEFYNYLKTNYIKMDVPTFTIFMDEPDRNLSLQNLKQIYNILSYQKDNTQIIAVIHNPLLINRLAKKEYINIIELSPDYLYKVRRFVQDFSK